MMRITIEIDGYESTQAFSQTRPDEALDAPPAELARAAAAIGALSAGPAPASADASVQLGEPLPQAPPAPPQDAGSAPDAETA